MAHALQPNVDTTALAAQLPPVLGARCYSWYFFAFKVRLPQRQQPHADVWHARLTHCTPYACRLNQPRTLRILACRHACRVLQCTGEHKGASRLHRAFVPRCCPAHASQIKPALLLGQPRTRPRMTIQGAISHVRLWGRPLLLLCAQPLPVACGHACARGLRRGIIMRATLLVLQQAGVQR